MKLLLAIHGILQGATRPGWVDELDAWAARAMPEVKVVKKEYHAGPFPRLNCLVKDPILARQIANEVALFVHPDTNLQLYFVAHSNGGVIALRAVKLLAQRGIKTAAAIFAQAAIESDVEKSGVLELVRRGHLGRAIAWSNSGDEVVHFHGIERWLAWPYGSLGNHGWTLGGRTYSSPEIINRIAPATWGHTGCWAPEHLSDSFSAIRQTLKH